MIPRPWAATWRAPNYKCVVREPNGRRHEWVLYAPSAEELRARLERDYEVLTITNFSFTNWEQTAATKLGEWVALRAQVAVDFDREVWSVLKAHLFELFGGKCAYCDSDIQAVSSGDVEHFRPKRRVEDDPGHPGYYWLAYEPTNLLPVCEICNRPNKRNEFPLEDGTRAYDAATVAGEKPLLLNPYFDDPLEHLDCDEMGVVSGRTPRGKVSEKVYGLNRVKLVERRARVITDWENKFKVRMMNADDEVTALREMRDELRRGILEYSGELLCVYLRTLKKRADAAHAILRDPGAEFP